MSIDPTFGRPFERFGPVSSFQQPVSAPVDGPFDGTLVALPCISPEWLKLLLGAAAQLENPSAWKPGISDSTTLLAVQRAQELRAALAEGAACVNPVIAVALDCTNGLQYQTADGVWHVGTSMADICTCVRGCIVPAVPLQPVGETSDQLACNMAQYLANTVLQQMLATLSDAKAAGEDVNKWINSFAADFAAAAIWLEVAYQGLSDAFVTAIAFPLTDLEAVRDDTTWWNEVKCCFYAAFLDTPGTYVTSANLNVIATCVGTIPYPAHPWVPIMIGNLINNLGIAFWQGVQQGGALATGDCSACTTWCRTLDFRAGPQGYSLIGPEVGGYTDGQWISGTGWRGTYDPPNGAMSIHVDAATWPAGGTIESIDITWGADGSTTASNPPRDRKVVVFNGASAVHTITLDYGATSGIVTQRFTFAAVAATEVSVQMGENSTGSGVIILQSLTFRGTGANPYGANNCT